LKELVRPDPARVAVDDMGGFLRASARRRKRGVPGERARHGLFLC